MPQERQQAQVSPIKPTFSEDKDDILSNIDLSPRRTSANVEENEIQHPKEQQDEVESLVIDKPHAEESNISLRPARIRRLPQRY